MFSAFLSVAPAAEGKGGEGEGGGKKKEDPAGWRTAGRPAEVGFDHLLARAAQGRAHFF